MRIILIQAEIEEAIRTYVGNTVSIGDHELEVDLTAGRGGNGFTATIDIKTGNQAKVELVDLPSADAPAGVDVKAKVEKAEKIDSTKPLFGGKSADAKSA